MTDAVRIMVLFGSLPSYFPERHGVFDRARAGLSALAEAEGAMMSFHQPVVINAEDAAAGLLEAARFGADLVLLLHGGFTMGDVARTLSESGMRIGFWSVPEPVFEKDIQLNGFVSLNMSLSITGKFRPAGHSPVAWYFGEADDAVFRRRFVNTIRSLRVLKALNGLRVGRVGGLAPTFYNMDVDREALAASWSAEIVDLSIEALREAANAIGDGLVAAEAVAMAAAAKVEIAGDDLRLSARYALAIAGLMDRENLGAVAISDWPALQDDPGFHPGAAFSWVEERYGRAVASEGDVLGAMSQIAVLAAGGTTGCLLDLCAPDIARGRMLVWHGGGGAIHLGDDNGARWINHPMLGRGSTDQPRIGAILDLTFADGPVTLVRLGDNGTAIFALEAEVVRGGQPGFDGVRGWLANFSQCGTDLTLEDVLETVMIHGLEHHFVLMAGHFSDVFAEVSTWGGLRWQSALKASGYLAGRPSAGGVQP
ncbi:MAG: hypothetical protein Q8L54_07925 [Devosia sp.]|nr:hypothetical protein [Devosia sp.]